MAVIQSIGINVRRDHNVDFDAAKLFVSSRLVYSACSCNMLRRAIITTPTKKENAGRCSHSTTAGSATGLVSAELPTTPLRTPELLQLLLCSPS